MDGGGTDWNTALLENLSQNCLITLGTRSLSKAIFDQRHRGFCTPIKDRRSRSVYVFVFFILSHGGPRMIYGVDGLPVQISKLTEEFTASSCKTLAGKPKVFFIQACQGKKRTAYSKASPRCLRVVRSDIVPMPPVQDEPLDDMMHPNPSDFLLGFSTAPGYISYRDSRSGSFYIQSLCRQIQENVKGTCSLEFKLTYILMFEVKLNLYWCVVNPIYKTDRT
ncbi:CASP8 [Mytilus edulis]|uniref:CASP8 n=1 Tax=Mytilus edulis TaxID=6550 RepID=A0A8S3VLR1_MYTED|nr:CASP8 [Mytilus edulis]